MLFPWFGLHKDGTCLRNATNARNLSQTELLTLSGWLCSLACSCGLFYHLNMGSSCYVPRRGDVDSICIRSSVLNCFVCWRQLKYIWKKQNFSSFDRSEHIRKLSVNRPTTTDYPCFLSVTYLFLLVGKPLHISRINVALSPLHTESLLCSPFFRRKPVWYVNTVTLWKGWRHWDSLSIHVALMDTRGINNPLMPLFDLDWLYSLQR